MTDEHASLSPQPLPTHVAITLAAREQVSPETTLRNILEIINIAVSLKIPMLTLHFPSTSTTAEIDAVTTLFTALMHEPFLDQHQIKVSVLGKWYELPDRALEPIKHVISATRDYDSIFVNICVRHDGQEDIADGVRLLAKHVQLGKLAPEQVTKETLKDALITSTLVPPSIIIVPAPFHSTGGVLLWDSPGAIVHFSGTPWQDFGKEAFLKSISFFQQHG